MNNKDSAYLRSFETHNEKDGKRKSGINRQDDQSFSASKFWSPKSRKEESNKHSSKQNEGQKKNPAPAAPPVSKSISQGYLYYKHLGVDVCPKINIDQSSHTGRAINEGRYVFVNGRMVSREDLRNEND